MTVNQIDVAASPHDVFTVLLDPYAYEKWVVGSKEVRAVDEHWPAPGSRFHHTIGTPGINIKDTSKLIEVQPDQRVVLEVRFRPVGVAVVTLDLEPVRERRGTRITMTEEPKSGPARTLWSRVVAAAVHVRNALSLRRLARLSERVAARAPEPGHDTATGTDPDAKYATPGYEDKSFGQAVNQDQELADELLDETDGDVEEAERRFRRESAGSPAIERQHEQE